MTDIMRDANGNPIGNFAVDNANIGISSNVQDLPLTTTAATPVAVVVPQANGNFEVYLFLRVTVAATVITATVTYTDAAGTAQTKTFVSAVSEAVGNYDFNAFVNAAQGQPITVNVTAGTANQVNASAAIVAV